MTPALVAAIESDCLLESHVDLARRFEVSRKTVTAIADRLCASLDIAAAASANSPRNLVLRGIEAGRHKPLFGFDPKGGKVVAVFSSVLDPMIRRSIGTSGDIAFITDVANAQALKTQGINGVVAIHRMAAARAVEALLASCWKGFIALLPTPASRDAFPLSRQMAMHRYALRQVEFERVAELCRNHPIVGRFVEAKDELLSVFDHDREDLALSALRTWGRGLTDRLRMAFKPVVDWIVMWGPLVINNAYGLVSPSVWEATGRHKAVLRPYDSLERLLSRERAAIYQPALVGAAAAPLRPQPFTPGSLR
ncbi:hypothetical protein [Bosea sp. RAC05]|uniref:hypothetical protein n=1 Tax=Bosea sp. RAC05 TaxID=1842539 RepID=UPI00083E3CA3|nr:hypothetical protein [Bosea sp. RAC05]